MRKAGGTFVNDSGSSGIFFNLLFPTFDCGPLLSEVGCWKIETLIPWKDEVAVVAVGL